MPPTRAPARPGIAAAEDFFALMKPRVMSLVLFTAFVGLVAAPEPIHPWLAFVSLLAIAIGAGASGALNMWYDADVDALMRRTAGRPLPRGRHCAWRGAWIWPVPGGGFGSSARPFRQLGRGRAVSPSPSSSMSSSTPCGSSGWTPQNIVIGGAAGAFPPIIGWAVATGSIDLGPARPVPDHLHVDAAAFLGSGSVPGRGLCARWSADAAGGGGRR